MVSNIIVGIVTGIGAAWISIWQSRVLRLWEKREDSYLEVLNSLQAMYRANDEWYQAELNHRDIPAERAKELHEIWAKEKTKLIRHADLGAFLTSERAEEILGRLNKALAKTYNTYFEDLDEDAAALRDALSAVKESAIADRRQVPLAIFKARKLA